MKFFLVFLLFVPGLGNVLGKQVNIGDDLTYDDLLQTNVTCAAKDTCNEEFAVPFSDRFCDCDSDCSEFGTCCIDSEHRGALDQMVECRNVQLSFSRSGYFLVSMCPPEVDSDSAWKDLCERDWDGEEDLMKLAPVSSLDTSVSYKNYYCFRCHEGDGKFLRWDIRLQSHFVNESKVIDDDLSVTYDKKEQKWIATTNDGYVLDHIQWDFRAPGELAVSPGICKFVSVSDCDPSWTDDDVRKKCRAYTAVVYSEEDDAISFKNPHCALCNFQLAENMNCDVIAIATSFGTKEVFSFSRLLNFHFEDEEKSRAKKCSDNQLWDPYAKKCRRLFCAIPGYIVKKGICTPP